MPPCPHLNFVLIDKAVDPPGEARSDRQIGHMLVKALEQRAKERGMTQFTNKMGQMVNIEGAYDRMTLGGYLADDETEFDEAIRDSAAFGIIPEGTTLQTLREKGTVRWTGWGMIGHGLAQASTIYPDQTHNPFRWHTEEKVPYPTLTRRAQFYVDHDWFLEGGEEIPVHTANAN